MSGASAPLDRRWPRDSNATTISSKIIFSAETSLPATSTATSFKATSAASDYRALGAFVMFNLTSQRSVTLGCGHGRHAQARARMPASDRGDAQCRDRDIQRRPA
jgi:hypothetical protein